MPLPDPPMGRADWRPDSTLDLLARAKAGDAQSVEELFARCLPTLRRWAHGRLPQPARDGSDTEDVVQDAVLRTLQRLHAFEPRHQGALQGYLRQAVDNQIYDKLRRAQRRPTASLSESFPGTSPSPLELAIGAERLARYEAALQRLRRSDREAIIARFEMQQSYEEIATALGKPTANAARVAVTRAVAHLLTELDLDQ